MRYEKEIFYNEGKNIAQRLLRETINVPSLETFKVRLNGSPSNLI